MSKIEWIIAIAMTVSIYAKADPEYMLAIGHRVTTPYGEPATVTAIVKKNGKRIVTVKKISNNDILTYYAYQLREPDGGYYFEGNPDRFFSDVRIGDKVRVSLDGHVSTVVDKKADLIFYDRNVSDFGNKIFFERDLTFPDNSRYVKRPENDSETTAVNPVTTEEEQNQVSGKTASKKSDKQVTKRQPLPSIMVKAENGGGEVDAMSILKSFTRDAVEEAVKNGDPVTEQPELRQIQDKMFRAILKPEGGSVALLALAGVGKSALISGMMARVAAGDIPDEIAKYHFIYVDVAAIQAGAGILGMIEARSNAMVKMSENAPVIYIVDEAHALSGIGTHSGNPNNILQSWKPGLQKGTFKAIFISTPDEYAGMVGVDPALERRFATVGMQEPTGKKLVSILRSWCDRYGLKKISDQIFEEAIRFSDEFAMEGAQPSRTTALLSELYSIRAFNGSQNKPVTMGELKQAAQEKYEIDPAELDEKVLRERYENLEKALQALSGQDEAKDALLKETRAVLMGTHDHTKPRFRLLFDGLKGQGKTEIIKIFSQAMGLPGNNRLMMSQFATPYDVDAMKAQIAGFFKANAFTVLFFDEVEKAHPVVQQALLGILDSGVMSYEAKSSGKTVARTLRLHNTAMFLASNAGAGYLASLKSKSDFNEKDYRTYLVEHGINEYLLDRLNAAVPFFATDKSQFRGVVRIQIDKALAEISKNLQYQLALFGKDEMVNALAEKYYTPQISNRDSDRIVSSYIRDTVTHILFTQGKTANKTLGLQWTGTGLNVAQARCESLFLQDN
jgi:ATP-dependent Clp protease ATP-binding subunit ClpC